MRNPTVNKFIGYVVLFAGFFFWYLGFKDQTIDGQNIHIWLTILGGVLDLGAFIWMIWKVRCPHCGKILNLKFGDISVCPYCGQSTDV